MRLSIVSTLFKSADRIEEFCRRAAEAATNFAGDDYEIVLVDDGSPDQSLEIARQAFVQNERIRIVELSRNFGHHKAMMTGLAFARGDFVFLLDADLEESPEWLEPFSEKLMSEDCDVIYGVQGQRRGSFIERITGHLFYRIVPLFSGIDLPRNSVTARLMRRNYVDALLRHDERQMFIAGLWHMTGFDQRPLVVSKGDSSPTTYTLGKKFHMLITAITSQGSGPLMVIFYTGLLIFCVAAIFNAYLVMNRLFGGDVLDGWTSIIASIWLLGGIMISFIGVIGIYLSNIYLETKRRPYTIVRQVIEKHGNSANNTELQRSSIDEVRKRTQI